MISSLRRIIPTIESEIDRHYYYCYGDGSVQIEQTGSVIVYIVRGERFGDYLRNQYGTSVRIPSIRSDVTFRRVNIFGAPWTNKFGYPFPEGSFGSDLSFAGSFSCLNPSNLVRGSGQIVSIGADTIRVRSDDNRELNFSLGSCSRL